MILFEKASVRSIRDGQKTQTRRLWKKARAKVGAVHQARTELFGKPFAYLRITAVRRERIDSISSRDARREGYKSRMYFFAAWHRINGVMEGSTLVWVVSFVRVRKPRKKAEVGAVVREALAGFAFALLGFLLLAVIT